MKSYSLLLSCFILCIVLCSCNKEEWLDVKSNKADVTPASFKDYQALLDNTTLMNQNYPALGMVSADNYYTSYTNWLAVNTATERNAYLWLPDIYQGEFLLTDWVPQYAVIMQANTVLEGILRQPGAAQQQKNWQELKGAALFFRALAHYNLVQLFSKTYTPVSANTDAGIPLRLSSDVNELSVRSSITQTYQQIIADATGASKILPLTSVYQTRPCKPAADFLLAKVYTDMEQYLLAKQACDTALSKYNHLIDYNTLNASANYPFPAYPNHKEIIFWCQISAFTITLPLGFRAVIDSVLYRSYLPNDLRKNIFFSPQNSNGQVFFKGNYTGSVTPFGGLATNELYLLRAECLARLGKTDEALADLNTLLQKRWKSGSFIPYTANSPEQALGLVLAERRKELPFTANLRWQDLKRLNKEPRFATTLTRILNNQTYTLPPGDKRYVLPIPDIEIQLSGIPQNQRH